MLSACVFHLRLSEGKLQEYEDVLARMLRCVAMFRHSTKQFCLYSGVFLWVSEKPYSWTQIIPFSCCLIKFLWKCLGSSQHIFLRGKDFAQRTDLMWIIFINPNSTLYKAHGIVVAKFSRLMTFKEASLFILKPINVLFGRHAQLLCKAGGTVPVSYKVSPQVVSCFIVRNSLLEVLCKFLVAGAPWVDRLVALMFSRRR